LDLNLALDLVEDEERLSKLTMGQLISMFNVMDVEREIRKEGKKGVEVRAAK
jgi:hypothetical protein